MNTSESALSFRLARSQSPSNRQPMEESASSDKDCVLLPVSHANPKQEAGKSFALTRG